ncbi:hypothetical protein [Pinibacter soli]|uniref:Permease n=1 Tax=Pinibacter soli TaxID=3044211 RepID=A0ABT6RDI4_9BACT|nr:hypothetical protein [Pinibacter soli]MDI3320632.1 hypothetical protein [Pinibacter soli]
MQENQIDLLTHELAPENALPRKKMLPLWIKIFAWIFLIFSLFVPIVLVLGVSEHDAKLALYGLETNKPFSLTGIIITAIFAIKGITAFGLLKEKDWAIKIGIVDAIIGITICPLVMFSPVIGSTGGFSIRLELIALVPYLLKLLKIKPQWESFMYV